MNILEALKKYIRANGGSSRANNISEAVKDLDSIPQGSGGGGMVVHFNVDNEGNVTADHTPSEVKNAMLSMPVSAVIEYMGEIFYAYICSFYNPDAEKSVRLHVNFLTAEDNDAVLMTLVREGVSTDDWFFGA